MVWAEYGILVSRFAVDFTGNGNQKIRFAGLPGILRIYEKPDIRFAGFQGESDWALKTHTLGPPCDSRIWPIWGGPILGQNSAFDQFFDDFSKKAKIPPNIGPEAVVMAELSGRFVNSMI